LTNKQKHRHHIHTELVCTSILRPHCISGADNGAFCAVNGRVQYFRLELPNSYGEWRIILQIFPFPAKA